MTNASATPAFKRRGWAEGFEVILGYTEIFEASLGYKRCCPKQNKTNKTNVNLLSLCYMHFLFLFDIVSLSFVLLLETGSHCIALAHLELIK